MSAKMKDRDCRGHSSRKGRGTAHSSPRLADKVARMTDSLPGIQSRREVIVLDNPIAGTCDRALPVHELVDALQILDLSPILCRDRAALSERVRESGDRLRCVVAAGGD